MPSDLHEKTIDKFCKQHGFIKHSFAAFAKFCFLNDQLDTPILDLQSVFQELLTHDEYNTGFWAGIKKDIKSAAASQWCDFGSSLDSTDDYNVDRYLKFHRENFRCVPDAWRFAEHHIEVLEVTDSNGPTWDKLAQFSFACDELFRGPSMRMSLVEYNCSNGGVFLHNLGYPFDIEYDGAIPTGLSRYEFFKMRDQDKMRHYYENAYFDQYSGELSWQP